jgi:hypothetical protein
MNIKRKYQIIIVLIIALTLITISTASAAPKSPFKGVWRAVDLDGSNIQLSIAGGGQGIFHLIWTDDYWGICEGDPGLGKGVGELDENDPYILHTDWIIKCTSRHESYPYQFDAEYDPITDKLTFQLGVVWDRVGH